MAGKVFYFRLYFILILITALGFASGYIYSTGLFTGGDKAGGNTGIADAAGNEKAGATDASSRVVMQPQDLIEEADGRDRLSYKADFVFKTYYTGCGHTVYNYGTAAERYIGLNEEELSSKFPGWGIEEFAGHRVTFGKVKQEKCPEHLLVKLDEGRITVFYDNGKGEIKEKTSILERNLRKEDRNRLAEGIRVDTENELARLLEDFGS